MWQQWWSSEGLNKYEVSFLSSEGIWRAVWLTVAHLDTDNFPHHPLSLVELTIMGNNKCGFWLQRVLFMHFLELLSFEEFIIMGNVISLACECRKKLLCISLSHYHLWSSELWEIINLACEWWSLIYAFFHNHCHFKTYLRWFTSEAKLHNARDAVNRHSLSVHSHWKRHCQALFSYKCDTIHWLLPWQTILHGFLKRRRRRRKGGWGEELLMLTLSLNN